MHRFSQFFVCWHLQNTVHAKLALPQPHLAELHGCSEEQLQLISFKTQAGAGGLALVTVTDLELLLVLPSSSRIM